MIILYIIRHDLSIVCQLFSLLPNFLPCQGHLFPHGSIDRKFQAEGSVQNFLDEGVEKD